MILDATDALAEAIKEVTRDLSMPDTTGGSGAPDVYNGFVPKKRRGETDPRMPFIVVRIEEGSDSQPENGAYNTTMQAMIIIGCKRETDEEGYRDVVTIVEKIRRRLLSAPVFGGRYRAERPLEWRISDDETWPNWYGVMTIPVVIPQPVELDSVEDEGLVYGQTYPSGRA